MDLDSTIEIDEEESADGILRHIRATFEASGADSIFGSSDEGFKRELVVRKIHSYPVGNLSSSRRHSFSSTTPAKVVTLSESQTIHGASDPRIKVYIPDPQNGGVQVLTIRVKQRCLWPDMKDSQTIAIPLLSGETRLEGCENIVKLQDGKMRAVLLGDHGIQMSLDDQTICPLPSAVPYRAYDPLTLLTQTGDTDKDVGKNRLLQPPAGPTTTQHTGFSGRFDHIGQDGVHHRRQVQLRPSQASVDEILSLCEVILPRYQARAVRKTWCESCAWLNAHPENLASTGSNVESVALAATVFTFTAGLIDAKARAALSISRMAAGKRPQQKRPTQHHEQESRIFESSAWSWMPSHCSSPRRSPKGNENRKDQLLIIAAALADELSGAEEAKPSPSIAAL
jgi:anaphase-promoting complex subunit 1